MPSLLSRKGGFAIPGTRGKSPAPAKKGGASPPDAKVDKVQKKERKEKDEVTVLKDRLAKGHRLNDQELAQLELAAVARWNQLQREDDEELDRQREAEREKEQQREQRLNKELKELRTAAAADRAHLERAGAAVADELRGLREMRDAAAADRLNLESSVASELAELRAMRDQAAREQARRAALSASELEEESFLLSSIYDDAGAGYASASYSEAPKSSAMVPTEDTATADASASSSAAPPVAPQVAAAAAGEAARQADSAAYEISVTTSADNMTTPAKKRAVAPKRKPKQQPAAAPAMDYETMLRMTAFEDWASEQMRKAEKKGDAPPPRGQLEGMWGEVAAPIRGRYEKEAALKLQRAGVAGVDAGDQKAKAGAAGAAAAPGDEPPAPNGNRARVDFGRTPKKPDQPVMRKAKRPPPPPRPAGSVIADWMTLITLVALAALLVTRSYVCLPADFEWSDLLPTALLPAGILTRGGRQLWPTAEEPAAAPAPATANTAANAIATVEAVLADDMREARAAASAYRAALSTELSVSCGHVAFWQEPGSGLLHVSALLVACLLVITLTRQLVARCSHALAKRGEEAKMPLLPVAAASPGGSQPPIAAEGGGVVELPSFAPWSALACAELFIASYAARLFMPAQPHTTARAASDTEVTLAGVWLWVGGGPVTTAAHASVLVCVALLLLAAARRGMQMWWWGREYNAWLYPPAAKPPSAPKAAPKVNPAEKAAAATAAEEEARRGKRGAGRTPAKTPTAGKTSSKKQLFPMRWLCPCFGGGAAPAAPQGKEDGRRGGLPASSKKGFAGRGGVKSMV